ncbi:hypothetical protein [Sphingomonas sp. CLY1604]|uniref:hypothetical protein n=1 Tax=Sphingomonas sp. CLY1604 TaxID=3457786 RepID=UPI003FD8467E
MSPSIEPEEWAGLERKLLDAHRRGDATTLVAIYTRAADTLERDARIDEACFYLTQAYVLALETGAAETAALDRRLVAHGRNWMVPEWA